MVNGRTASSGLYSCKMSVFLVPTTRKFTPLQICTPNRNSYSHEQLTLFARLTGLNCKISLCCLFKINRVGSQRVAIYVGILRARKTSLNCFIVFVRIIYPAEVFKLNPIILLCGLGNSLYQIH